MLGTEPFDFEVAIKDQSDRQIERAVLYTADATARQSDFFRLVSPMLATQGLISNVKTLQDLLTLEVCQGFQFPDNPELASRIGAACREAADCKDENAKFKYKLQVAQKMIIVEAMLELNKSFFDFARSAMPGSLQTMSVRQAIDDGGKKLFEAKISEDHKALKKWNNQLLRIKK